MVSKTRLYLNPNDARYLCHLENLFARMYVATCDAILRVTRSNVKYVKWQQCRGQIRRTKNHMIKFLKKCPSNYSVFSIVPIIESNLKTNALFGSENFKAEEAFGGSVIVVSPRI